MHRKEAVTTTTTSPDDGMNNNHHLYTDENSKSVDGNNAYSTSSHASAHAETAAVAEALNTPRLSKLETDNDVPTP